MRNKITGKNTFLSLSLVSSLIGATMLAAGVKEKAETNEKHIFENKTRIEKVGDKQQTISKSLSKIEGKLDIIIQKVVR